jgi:hypothetical protein
MTETVLDLLQAASDDPRDTSTASVVPNTQLLIALNRIYTESRTPNVTSCGARFNSAF